MSKGEIKFTEGGLRNIRDHGEPGNAPILVLGKFAGDLVGRPTGEGPGVMISLEQIVGLERLDGKVKTKKGDATLLKTKGGSLVVSTQDETYIFYPEEVEVMEQEYAKLQNL